MALDEAGLEDAAILLMSLGEEEAAAVLQAPLAARGAKPRRDDRAHDVGAEGAPRQGARQVHQHRAGDAARSSPTPAATSRNVLKKALDEDKANLLIDRILQNGDISGIEGLKWMDAASIGEMLRHEHPQIVAAVLVHLDTDQAVGGAEDLRRAAAQRGAGPHRHARRHPALGAEGPERGHGPHGHRRRAGAHGAARRRQDRGRDDQPARHRDRDRRARLHPRGRQRPRAARHGQPVHLRRPDARRRPRHPGAAEGSAVRVARRRAEGRQARAARPRLKNMSTRAAETLQAKSSTRAARCASPRSRPSRRSCSRSCAASPRKASS